MTALLVIASAYAIIATILGVTIVRRSRRNTVPGRAILAIVDGVEADHGHCPNPGCIRARIELRNLANGVTT